VTQPSYAERRKLQLREEIIEAAIDVFSEVGYHDAAVAEIAKRVGIGHSTFYRHFENKRAILDEVITTVMQRSMAALTAENAIEAAANLDEYRGQCTRIGAALNEICNDLRVVRLLLIEAASIDPEMRQRIDGMFDVAVMLTGGYFEHGRELGYLRADLDTHATGRVIIAIVLGLAMMGLNPAMDPDARRRAVEAGIRVMFDGIANSAPIDEH
jgi:AcrR family transcriptional regulator